MKSELLNSVRRTLGKLGVGILLLPIHTAFSAPNDLIGRDESGLNIGLLGSVGDLHPWQLKNSAAEFIFYLTSMPLAALDADWKWQCFLCANPLDPENPAIKIVQIKNYPKKMEVTWKIGDQITWGDGTPVTGYDALFSWKIASLPNVPLLNPRLFASIEKVTVDHAEPKIFTIFFNGVTIPDLEVGGLFLIPQHLDKPFLKRLEQGDSAFHELSTFFVNPLNPGLANGPYVVVDRQENKTIRLKANRYFFGKKPPYVNITIHLEPSISRLTQMLETHEIDMIAEAGQLPGDSEYLEKWFKQQGESSGLRAVHADTLMLEQVTLNLRNPRLADVRVRQALSAAIDRSKILAMLALPELLLPTTSIFHPNGKDFPTSSNLAMANSTNAETLLKEANWIRGSDHFLRQDDEILTLEIATVAGNQIRARIAEEIKTAWEKLGIKVSIIAIPPEHFFGRTIKNANFSGAALFAWERDAETLPISVLDSREIPTARNDYSGQNISSWENKKADRIFDKFSLTSAVEGRAQLLAELQEEIQRDVPLIPLFFNRRVAIVPKELSKYRASSHQFPSSLWIGEWTDAVRVNP